MSNQHDVKEHNQEGIGPPNNSRSMDESSLTCHQALVHSVKPGACTRCRLVCSMRLYGTLSGTGQQDFIYIGPAVVAIVSSM